MSNQPIIKPISNKSYTVKQSKFDNVPSLPARMLLVAPSGGGKTVLLTNLLTKIYDQCFSRIYVFSQSVEVDSAWVPVRNYIKDKLKVN